VLPRLPIGVTSADAGGGHETGDGRQQGDEDHKAAAHQRMMAQN